MKRSNIFPFILSVIGVVLCAYGMYSKYKDTAAEATVPKSITINNAINNPFFVGACSTDYVRMSGSVRIAGATEVYCDCVTTEAKAITDHSWRMPNESEHYAIVSMCKEVADTTEVVHGSESDAALYAAVSN